MKLKINRYSIEIIPEHEVDEAYIEEVLGLKNKGDKCLAIRKAPLGFDHALAYVEIMPYARPVPNQECTQK